jgi:hypothetical protein
LTTDERGMRTEVKSRLQTVDITTYGHLARKKFDRCFRSELFIVDAGMSFLHFKLEAIALFTVAVVFTRTKQRFEGRPFWIQATHLAFFGTLAIMTVGGLRLLVYLLLDPKLFFNVFAQQRLFRVDPRLMVSYGVLFAVCSLWFFWTLDDLGQLRKGAKRGANWVVIPYCASYPIIMMINVGHLHGLGRGLAQCTLLVSVATLAIGASVTAFYRSKSMGEILASAALCPKPPV